MIWSKGLIRHGHRHARAILSEEDLERLVREQARPGDMVVCLGAGTISTWANGLPQRLERNRAMTLSLTLAAVWALAANVLAMIPSRDNHWRRAYVLIALGIPLLGYVTYENGPWWGLAVLLGGDVGAALAGAVFRALAETCARAVNLRKTAALGKSLTFSSGRPDNQTGISRVPV